MACSRTDANAPAGCWLRARVAENAAHQREELHFDGDEHFRTAGRSRVYVVLGEDLRLDPSARFIAERGPIPAALVQRTVGHLVVVLREPEAGALWPRVRIVNDPTVAAVRKDRRSAPFRDLLFLFVAPVLAARGKRILYPTDSIVRSHLPGNFTRARWRCAADPPSWPAMHHRGHGVILPDSTAEGSTFFAIM